ncbi:Protein angel 1 [Entomortierella beljakovae]|nr:Protein angel 1 [Entomortierella beljakovae]
MNNNRNNNSNQYDQWEWFGEESASRNRISNRMDSEFTSNQPSQPQPPQQSALQIYRQHQNQQRYQQQEQRHHQQRHRPRPHYHQAHYHQGQYYPNHDQSGTQQRRQYYQSSRPRQSYDPQQNLARPSYRPSRQFTGDATGYGTSWDVTQRKWDNLDNQPTADQVTFTIMSYNLLADSLAKANPHLYRTCARHAMKWENRSRTLLTELQKLESHSLDFYCFQELDSKDYEGMFKKQFSQWGYTGFFKKRNGDKHDGCAIFFRNKSPNKGMIKIAQLKMLLEKAEKAISEHGMNIPIAIDSRYMSGQVLNKSRPGYHDNSIREFHEAFGSLLGSYTTPIYRAFVNSDD